jgi:antitoxin component of RelBE/YafQ-DinJ toxin-antitoxin module
MQKAKKIKVSMNITEQLKDEVQKIAEAKGLTMTALTILALNDLIKREGGSTNGKKAVNGI